MPKSILEDLFGTGTADSVRLRLEPETCCVCGTVFAMEAKMRQNLLEDGGSFYCPNGHSQHYTEPEVARLKKQLAREAKMREAMETTLRDTERQNAALERSRSAIRGQVTKLKNEIARGLCPCCQQHFPDLESHMTQAHPDFVKEEEG